MKKITLFDTAFGKASSLEEQAKKAVPFVTENIKLISLSETDIDIINSLKTIVHSPMNNIFHHIIDAGKLDNYLLMDLTSMKKVPLPEILTMSEISVDGLRINANIPNSMKKLWVNLTPILGARRMASSSIVINDLTTLQGLIVRGSLSMSYDAADAWLTPKLASFIIESYSITISSLIKRTYNLDIFDTSFIQILFAIYYAQLLGPLKGDLKNPPLLNRCGFLGSMGDINNILDKISPYRENNSNDLLTPEKISKILVEVGPTRMKNFTVNNLYRFISMGPMDSQSMMLAVDYPPYWVFQVLKTLSGAKNPLLNMILKMSKLNKKAEEFADELNYSRYIEKMGR